MRVSRPFQLNPEDVREALELAKPDHGPYLRAVAQMREAYRAAEIALGGPVELVSEVPPEYEKTGPDWVVTFKFRRKIDAG
jgi:hypothetical protein